MSVSLQFERATAYLQQTNEEGQSLYSHLATLLTQLTLQQQSSSATPLSLETLSFQLKQAHIKQQQYQEIPAIVTTSNTTNLPTSLSATDEQLLTSLPDIDNIAVVLPSGSTCSPATIPAAIQLQDVLSMSPLLPAVGLSITKDNLYLLQYALSSVAQKYKLSNLRWWGIIRGTEADYYILETRLIAGPTKKPNTVSSKAALASLNKDEEDGHGINEYRYYVANQLTLSNNNNEWRELPNVTPNMLSISRDIRRYFTGHLDSVITGHPYYPYNEAGLLRATIARISHSAFLVPNGALISEERDAANGGGEVLINDSAWDGIIINDNQPLSWQHARAKILKKGRTEIWIDPEIVENEEEEENADETKKQQPEEEEEEEPQQEEEEEEEEEEEAVSGLASISDDTISASAGLTSFFSVRSSPSLGHPHAVHSAASLLWPGSYSIGQHQQYINVYIGDGQKYLSGNSYTPPALPVIKAEYKDKVIEDEEDPENPIGSRIKEQDDPLPESEKAKEDEDEDEDGQNEEEEEAEDGDEENAED